MHGSSSRVLSSLARQLGAARFNSSLAVVTFGVSPVGALGHGATTSVDSPRRVQHPAVDAALRSWRRDELGLPCVAAGLFHSAVALPGLGAFLCGKGAGGRLAQGDEDNADVLTHVQLAQQDGDSTDESADVHSAALGGLHSAFLTRSGHLYTAGFGGFGALGRGDYKAVLLASRVRFPGNDALRVASVAAGGAHTVAVSTDGQLFTFGRDEGDGRLGTPVGEGGVNTPTVVAMPPNIVPIAAAAGGFHTLVLARRGDDSTVLLSTGANANGECGRDNGATWTLGLMDWEAGVTRVSAGGFHSAALTQQGQVFTWGAGNGGALGHGDTRTQRRPKRVEGLPVSAAAVACGSGTTCAVGVDGSLWLWGKNAARFGTTSADVFSPARVALPLGMKALDVAVGATHIVILCAEEGP